MRKPQFQPSLAPLTEADREQLADWLRREQNHIVLERVNRPRPEGFGLNLATDKPLRTFYAKVAFLDLINVRLPADKKISLATFETLARRDLHLLISADDKTLDHAHQSILNATCDFASAGDNTPAQLATLQRLIDFPVRAEIRANKEERAQAKEDRDNEAHAMKREMHAHKIAYDNARLEIDKQTLALRREESARRVANSKLKTENSKLSSHDAALGITNYDVDGRPCDHLGPYATNWEDVRARARKAFGITPEESARRAELRRTWKQPEVANAQPTPSADETVTLQEPTHVAQTDCLPPIPTLNLNPNLTLNPNLASAETNRPDVAQTDGLSSVNHAARSHEEIHSNDAHGSGIERISAPANISSDVFHPCPTSISRDAANHHHTAQADPKSNITTPYPENLVQIHSADSALSALSSSSFPSSPPVKENLADRVDSYTVCRAQEYWAHRRTYTGWPHKQLPPEYITQYRHCPCGNATPCPIHESEEFGEYPDTFWKSSPHSVDYAACLRARNLPYRNPTEFL